MVTEDEWDAVGRQRYAEWEEHVASVSGGYLTFDIEQGFWKAWEDAWELAYGSGLTVES